MSELIVRPAIQNLRRMERLVALLGGGTRTSLRGFENHVVRTRFADPRVHAALNCASLGYTGLPRRRFPSDTLDSEPQG